MPAPDNSAELVELVRILSTGRLMTAAQIAAEMCCGKTTVHKRLSQLERRGHQLLRRRIREGKTGPMSVAYALSA